MLLEHYGAGRLFCIFAVWDNSPWWQCAMVWGRFFCTMLLVHYGAGVLWCWCTMVLVHTVVLDGGLSLVRDGATRLRLGGGAPARKLGQPRQTRIILNGNMRQKMIVELSKMAKRNRG